MKQPSKSLSSRIEAILFTEIPLPFTSSGRADKETDKGKLDRVLAQHEQRGRVIGDLLVRTGIVTPEQLEQVARHQQRHGISWTQALVDLNIVPPSSVNDVAAIMERELRDREAGCSLDDVLLAGNHVSAEVLEAAREHARQHQLSLEQALLELNAMTLEQLGAVMREAFGIGYIDLSHVSLQRSVVNLVPDNVITTFNLLPVARKGDKLEVAMANPRDETARNKLRLLTSMEIVPLLADRRQLRQQQKQFVLTFTAGDAAVDVRQSPAQMQDMIDSDSTVKMVEKIVEGAINARATDIHLEPAENHLRIRYRIDGQLYDIMTIPRDMGIPTVSRVKVLAGMDVTERRRPQDGRVSMELGQTTVKMRAATLPTYLGEKMMLRLLSEGNALLSLTELGFLPEQLEQVGRLMRRPAGMTLVTGPMGSGKTTTLYSMLHVLNQPTVNIVTLEDPVEIPLPGINQVNVDPKVQVDFAAGMRAILRQDADILMVGEIRDAETAQTAVRAAMTGHKVLATLHTNDAVGAISTLRHLEVRPFLISSSLLGVIAQRLLRRVCPACVKLEVPDAARKKELKLPANYRKKLPRAVGCPECHSTGYRGRVGVYEVFILDERIRALVAEGAPEKELHAAEKKAGMKTLVEAGKAKVLAGETTLEEVMRVLYTE